MLVIPTIIADKGDFKKIGQKLPYHSSFCEKFGLKF
jgi:hypothetical protein